MRGRHRARSDRAGAGVKARIAALAAGAAAAALLSMAGCATAPVRPSAQWLGVLPDSATLYVFLDVQRSADVLRSALEQAGPDMREVELLLERTDRLYASVEMAEGSASRVSVVALGSYPAGLIRSRLRGNRSWKTVKSPAGKYYVSSKAGLQVGVPGGYAVLASTGSIETLLARFAAPIAPAMPPEAAEGMDQTDLSLYLPELPGSLPGSLGGATLPIREVWLEARRAGDRYEVAGTCNTASERDARSLVLLLKLGLVAWMRSQELTDVSGRLSTVTVAADGAQVKLTGLYFAKEEIVPVLLALAGGSKGPSGAPGSGGAGQ
ncbi:MAG: hypothetical protein A2177_04940 [Spirochaetes bacterium RBG_13_68_11]|nr:MAG: hypothetical protein A2177_04940 [Spirochaetes bacterium RBG_13_68_11]